MLFSELREVLDPEPHAAPLNMAIDEVLLQQADRPTLRVYRWREPAVSFGYFGRASEAEQVSAGRSIVRRWTGGGIVEHGADLTYTLVVPRTHAFFQRAAPESYRAIHEAIERLLEGEGLSAHVVAAAGQTGTNVCFVNPVQYDLVADGKKIGGAAQRRTRWGLLHQGSLQAPRPLARLGGIFAGAFGLKIHRERLTIETLDRARMLAETKYGTAAWQRRF